MSILSVSCHCVIAASIYDTSDTSVTCVGVCLYLQVFTTFMTLVLCQVYHVVKGCVTCVMLSCVLRQACGVIVCHVRCVMSLCVMSGV